MKKAISLLLTAIMLCACFAVVASAEEEPVNYALTAKYTVESSNEKMYGLEPEGRGADYDHTKLNDGYTGYDECTGLDIVYDPNGTGNKDDYVTVHTENTSVCYTGTGADITMIWDLGEVKNDVAKIGFLNCRSDYEWADDNQFEDFLDGIMTNYSRSFPTDNINLWTAGEDGKYVRLKQKDGWTYDIVGLENPYTTAVESDLKDCKQRNVYMVFNQSLVCRYIKISLSPKLYVMSLDEVQIFGGGEPGEIPVATTTAAPASQAQTDASKAETVASASETKAATTNVAAESEAQKTTAAPTPTSAPTKAPTKAPTEAKSEKGGSNVGLIIGIIAGIIVVAAIVVVVIKKKK